MEEDQAKVEAAKAEADEAVEERRDDTLGVEPQTTTPALDTRSLV